MGVIPKEEMRLENVCAIGVDGDICQNNGRNGLERNTVILETKSADDKGGITCISGGNQ